MAVTCWLQCACQHAQLTCHPSGSLLRQDAGESRSPDQRRELATAGLGGAHRVSSRKHGTERNATIYAPRAGTRSSRVSLIVAIFLLSLICACGKMVEYSSTKSEIVGQASQSQSRDEVSNSIGMRFRRIPAGTFMMGSETGSRDEVPVHAVRISEPYCLGVTEVTQSQWKAVMGDNPSYVLGSANHPVEMISWDDAVSFCKKLTQMDDRYDYRLPTEAEWEYACRAGTTGDYHGSLDQIAWYSENSHTTTHPVATKQANPWGLYDMSGNVLEWCQDWYDGDYYRQSPADDPAGPKQGEYRVLRGGAEHCNRKFCRSAQRFMAPPDDRSGYTYGLRVVLVMPTD